MQVIGRAPCDDSTNVLQRNLALPAVALGATAFIFGNHYLLPEALTSLQLPSGSPGAALEVMECLGSAYALVVLLYLPIAYLGFSAYGDCLSPNILDAPTGQPELQAAAAALLVLQALVDILVREDSLHPLGGERKASTALCSWLQRVVTILAGGVVAALLPMSLEFAGLAGGLFVLPIAFVLPALLSQATGVDSQWDPQWLLNTALVTVYSVVALIATSASIYSLFASASFQWLQITEGDINLWISGFGALPYMF